MVKKNQVEWVVIDEFPNYSVSTNGEVRNNTTNYIISTTTNQYGYAQVGLVRDGRQYKRGLAVLVAETFLPAPPTHQSITPINVNGDRTDCSVDNLMWRPRWFAVKYHRQFDEPPRGFRKPIVDVKTGEEFPTSWEAAVKYGLLDREILLATLNRTHVWPTYQEFQLID